MHNKIYEKIKNFIKENLIFIIILVVCTIILNIPLPYYINTPGGLINVKDKILIDNPKKIDGSFNMTYVTTYEANVLTLFISRFNKDWIIEKKVDAISINETEKDDSVRSHILLNEGGQNAVIYAYKKASKEVILNNTKLYVIYIDPTSETTLEVGDIIEEVGGLSVKSKDDIANVINNYNYDDEVTIKTNNGVRKAKIMNVDGSKKIGILLSSISELETNPKIKFNYKDNESGSSGGLMSTLYIYSALVGDITKGKRIAGTGTIDIEGNVGEISGVRFKLIGAVKNKVDVFFVPKENYDEAMELKNSKNYKIDIVKVSTFDEALNYLNNL